MTEDTAVLADDAGAKEKFKVIPAEDLAAATDAKLQIAVLDRGFIYVGKVSRRGDTLTIENAKNVRRWGTSRGLGELAAEGPKADTRLDPTPTVTVPLRALIHLIDCEPARWAT